MRFPTINLTLVVVLQSLAPLMPFGTAPVAAAEEPSGEAGALLAAARAARGVWNEFPGFEAALTVLDEHGQFRGRVTAGADFAVELRWQGSARSEWAARQLEQLVAHRRPDGGLTSRATFVAEATRHPLGRLVRLDDPAMGSEYRILDGRITEVHRTMGEQRFTISVLSFHDAADGKHFPAAYSVSFWDRKDGRLISARDVLVTWRRTGDFELPVRVVEVESQPGAKRFVRTLELAELALRPPAKPAASP